MRLKNTVMDHPVQQLLSFGEDVKKANEIVRTRIVCKDKSKYAGRILNGLISQIRMDDVSLDGTYSINAYALIDQDGGSNYVELRRVCRNLVHCGFEKEIYNTETKKRELLLFNFFEKMELKNGIVTAIFTRSMASYLLQLRREYTTYKFLEYKRLTSIYSQRLFEIIKSWSGLTEPREEYIENLHYLLNTPMSLRKDFRLFRLRVLEPAHKEITKMTELRYTWTPLRKGGENSKTGKVYAIRFTIRKPKPKPKVENNNDSNKKLTRKEKQLINSVHDCIGRIGYGVCYEDNDPDVCNICRRDNMFTGTKNPRPQTGA